MGRSRERARRHRLARLGTGLFVFAGWLWLRLVAGHPVSWGIPAVPASMRDYLPALLLISRGVVEGKCNNEEFGLERAKQILLAPGRSAQEVCAAILDQVQQFMCARPIHNDVSALALVRAAAAKVATAS